MQERTRDRRPSVPDRRQFRCRAIVDETPDGRPTCTIYSVDPDDSVYTSWLSAIDDAFVTLENMR